MKLKLRYSARAERDLLSIGEYTLRNWGPAQADHYLAELEECCRLLANNPALGYACDLVRPGLRALEKGQHVIFYRQEVAGIRIVRILHERMLPERRKIEDDLI